MMGCRLNSTVKVYNGHITYPTLHLDELPLYRRKGNNSFIELILYSDRATNTTYRRPQSTDYQFPST